MLEDSRPRQAIATPILADLPSVLLSDRAALPACAAIYFVLDAMDTVLYIGRSMSLVDRWKSHHRREQFDDADLRIAWCVVPVEQLVAYEDAWITAFRPQLNGTIIPRSSEIAPFKRIEVKLTDDDPLLAFLQEEARNLNMGVSNYLELLARAAYLLRRRGDASLVSLFGVDPMP